MSKSGEKALGVNRKLTKADIVDNIYLKVPASKKKIQQVVDLFFDSVRTGLLEGQVVELRGFGTFEVKTRKGRKARNPKTGEAVDVADHGVAIYRPGREIKNQVWKVVD